MFNISAYPVPIKHFDEIFQVYYNEAEVDPHITNTMNNKMFFE